MKFQQRGFASLLMTLSFLVANVSGGVLFVAPRGRTAHWTNWLVLGLDRHQWTAIHINICLLMLVVAGLHLYLNWAVFLGYIKRMAMRGLQLKQETLLAVLFTALVTAGACFDVPPFRAVTSYRYQIKAYWDQKPVTPAQPTVAGDDSWPLGVSRQHGQGRGRRWNAESGGW